jgi:iron complex transport system substrate-binding protein
MINKVQSIGLALIPAVILAGVSLSAREITDMSGARVKVPERIDRVFSASPPSTCMVYAIDPSLLVGVTMKIPAGAKPYLRGGFQNLPVMTASRAAGAHDQYRGVAEVKSRYGDKLELERKALRSEGK